MTFEVPHSEMEISKKFQLKFITKGKCYGLLWTILFLRLERPLTHIFVVIISSTFC